MEKRRRRRMLMVMLLSEKYDQRTNIILWIQNIKQHHQ
jgi:hypothetical protein